MAKLWPCKYGDGNVSELGSFVKLGSERAHLKCFSEDLLRQGVELGRAEVAREQAEARREAEEREQARAQALAERERAKKLAEENARLEKVRIQTLTKQAQEELKREAQGEARDRFSLVSDEIDPTDALRLSMEKIAAEDALRERQAADAAELASREALPKCVRCRASLDPVSAEHPAHCNRCWNDEGTGQGNKTANVDKIEEQVKDALKRGVRPLEIE